MSNHPFPLLVEGPFKWYWNEAVIKVTIKQHSPNMRHVARTHRVDLDWFWQRVAEDPGVNMKYINTKFQIADILTKGQFTAWQWNELCKSAPVVDSLFACERRTEPSVLKGPVAKVARIVSKVWAPCEGINDSWLGDIQCIHSRFATSKSSLLNTLSTVRFVSISYSATMTDPRAWIGISQEVFRRTFPTVQEASSKSTCWVTVRPGV